MWPGSWACARALWGTGFARTGWLDAAAIYRELRRRGITIRSMVDALIAAVAIRIDVPVLHRDRDFGAIAQHSALRLVTTN